ncbi:hypothetical protein FS837_008863 [Tulasnella sp. UAMH 9824]|nr:hypothetical protein FS837_008863 [Tulasnella sp. UAMH 9824]
MNFQNPGYGEGNSQAVASTRTRLDGQQGQLTRWKPRRRSSSVDRFPPPHQLDYGQSDPWFPISIPFSFKLPWFFGSGDQVSELRVKNQQLEDQVERMGRKEKDLRETLKENDRRLRERETELEELKTTFCMYNDCSEADIQSMADSINAKTQDLACNTAIRWLRTASKTSDSAGDGVEVTETEMDRVKRLIGTQLVNALSGGGQFTNTLLPLAWQASIFITVANVISSFSASLAGSSEERAGDAVLRKVAEQVMNGEAQPAYGRWRLITHKYLRGALSNMEQLAVQAYVSEALANCRVVGRLAMKSQCPNDQAFEDAFQSPLRSIVEEAFGLSTMIQERMITANYGPFLPRSGDPFDPKTMVVEKGDKVSENDHVVCTTGIGLVCWKKEGRDSTSKLSPQFVFKEAQVFTEASLNDLIPGP